MRRSSYKAKALSLLVILCILLSPLGCGESVSQADLALQAFLDDKSGPPEPEEADMRLKGKADAIVLPTISVTVWALGALIVYIGAQEVFKNTIKDFEAVLDMAFGGSADWSWAEQYDEPSSQADHLTESLNRIAYRSETSDFYSINGNDYLRFLSMVSPINIVDPKKLKDMLDGKVRPWGEYAKEYFAALQVASMHARHLEGSKTSDGLCAKATVRSLYEPYEDYIGLARANGPVDIIPAVVLASVKATIRCGLYDGSVRDFVYSYYDVSGPLDALPDIFISHMLKTAELLYKYVDVCQMPPRVKVQLDKGDCEEGALQ